MGGADVVAGDALRVAREVVPRRVDAVQLAAWHLDLAGTRGAGAEDDGVVELTEVRVGEVTPDLDAAHELDAGGRHHIDPTLHDGLVQLEIRDPVAEEAARPVVALVDDDGVAGTRELLGRSQPGRPAPHHGDGLARRRRALDRLHPALVEGALADRPLDLLDGDGLRRQPEHARRLARRRADPPGELGEVVGPAEVLEGGLPATVAEGVVEVGDRVAERAARLAEGDAAVHAPPGLEDHLGRGERQLHREVVEDALGHGPARRRPAREVEEVERVGHGVGLRIGCHPERAERVEGSLVRRGLTLSPRAPVEGAARQRPLAAPSLWGRLRAAPSAQDDTGEGSAGW